MKKKLGKIERCAADAVILDLEDSVTPANRDAARALVRDYLQSASSRNCELWVRINALECDDALADLVAVVPARPDGIVLPKTRSPVDVVTLDDYLTVLEAEHGIEAGAVAILTVCTETPEALFDLADYQGASPRLRALTWGAEDLSAELGASTNKDEQGNWTPVYQLARSLCLLAARAAGVEPLDTVYTDFRDQAGLAESCHTARRDGFTGKLAIHPDQVAVINAAFMPSPEELAQAERVVAAFAAAPDAGTLSVDGKMLDMPHLKQAQRILALVEREN